MFIHLYLEMVRIRDDQKERLLRRKAVMLFVKEGFDGLSMQKLARAARVSPATIYIYFKNREDLILQLSAELSKKMADATLDGFDPEMSFEEGMKIQWMNRARYCMKYPEEMHFIEQVRFSPFYEKSLQLTDKRFIEVMSKFGSNAVRRNELKELPFEVFWAIAFSPLYTLVKFHMHHVSMPGRKKFVLTDEILLTTLHRVLQALRP